MRFFLLAVVVVFAEAGHLRHSHVTSTSLSHLGPLFNKFRQVTSELQERPTPTEEPTADASLLLKALLEMEDYFEDSSHTYKRLAAFLKLKSSGATETLVGFALQYKRLADFLDAFPKDRAALAKRLSNGVSVEDLQAHLRSTAKEFSAEPAPLKRLADFMNVEDASPVAETHKRLADFMSVEDGRAAAQEALPELSKSELDGFVESYKRLADYLGCFSERHIVSVTLFAPTTMNVVSSEESVVNFLSQEYETKKLASSLTLPVEEAQAFVVQFKRLADYLKAEPALMKRLADYV